MKKGQDVIYIYADHFFTDVNENADKVHTIFENSNLCLPQAITSRDGWEIIKKIGGGKKTKQYLNQNEHGSVNYMKKRRIKKIIKNDYLRIKLNKSKFFKCWDFDVF